MPDVIAMKLFPSPPIGWPVNWFPQANTNRPDLVHAAIITQSGEHGRVNLTTFAKAAAPRPVQNCTHVLCPSHKRRPETTMRNGGWDFLPGLGPELYHPGVDDLEKFLRMTVPHGGSQEEDRLRERVLVLYSQRVPVADIAKKVEETVETVSGIVKEVVGTPHKVVGYGTQEMISKAEVEKMLNGVASKDDLKGMISQAEVEKMIAAAIATPKPSNTKAKAAG